MFSKINEMLLSLMGRFEREEGQGLAEYGLILALVSIAAIAALGLLAPALTGTFDVVPGGLAGGERPRVGRVRPDGSTAGVRAIRKDHGAMAGRSSDRGVGRRRFLARDTPKEREGE